MTDSEAEVYACPESKSVAIATATICNATGATRTAELSVVKASESAGDANRVAIISLEPGESGVVEELIGLLLGPEDFISGVASAASSVAIVLTGAVSS